MNTDSQRSKQEACFARATRVWLTVNHNASVTSSEFDIEDKKQLASNTWVGFKFQITKCTKSIVEISPYTRVNTHTG